MKMELNQVLTWTKLQFYFILFWGGNTLELKILQIQNKTISRTSLKISDKKKPDKKIISKLRTNQHG
jgi:hypothetical protein